MVQVTEFVGTQQGGFYLFIMYIKNTEEGGGSRAE
jgi:hypothetical protein